MPVLLVKQRISVSEPPSVGGLRVRDNVCDSSLPSWKARSPLPIGYNCTFLLALTAEAPMRRNRLLFMGWVRVIVGLNIRWKGYVYRKHLYTVSLMVSCSNMINDLMVCM